MIVHSSYRSTRFQTTVLLCSCRLLPSHLIYKPPEFTYSRFIFLISNFLLTQDFVPPEVIELLQSSRNTLIQELFQMRSHTLDKDARQEVSWSERFTRLYYFIATLVSLFSDFFVLLLFQDEESRFKSSSKHRQTTVTVVHKFKVLLQVYSPKTWSRLRGKRPVRAST